MNSGQSGVGSCPHPLEKTRKRIRVCSSRKIVGIDSASPNTLTVSHTENHFPGLDRSLVWVFRSGCPVLSQPKRGHSETSRLPRTAQWGGFEPDLLLQKSFTISQLFCVRNNSEIHLCAIRSGSPRKVCLKTVSLLYPVDGF